MSSWPLIKFVDAPAATATVRYDFNDQIPNPATSPAKKVTEFDPGVPTLEGDPDAVGQQWGFRSPSITHTIRGTKAQAMAALSAVSKEQLRRTNWLLFQPSAATQPVWFKTYRTGYQPITLDRVYVRVEGGGTAPLPDTWKITVPLVADAFAYGARQTMSTFQVVQGPVDLTTPTRTAMRVVLPAIKGDAPTALRVTITPSSASGDSGDQNSWLIGCVSGKSTMSDPVADIGTGDTFTAFTGTAAGSAGATYFSSTKRDVTIGAGSGVIKRLDGTIANVPAGRYKVLLRCEADGSTAIAKTYIFALAAGASGAFASAYAPSVSLDALPASTPAWVFRGWVDLGDFDLPFNSNPSRDLTDTLPAPSTTYPAAISLKIGTADNTAGAVRTDAFKLIPVDGPTVTETTLLRPTYTGANTQGPSNTGGFVQTVTFDGDSESTWATGSGSYGPGTLPFRPSSLKGAFPKANPAAEQNLLIIMALSQGRATTTTTVTALNAQAAVDVSYYPRFLHVGDGT